MSKKQYDNSVMTKPITNYVSSPVHSSENENEVLVYTDGYKNEIDCYSFPWGTSRNDMINVISKEQNKPIA